MMKRKVLDELKSAQKWTGQVHLRPTRAKDWADRLAQLLQLSVPVGLIENQFGNDKI